jgi:hypothetical protein
VREEFPLRRERNYTFNYERVQCICKRIYDLLNDGESNAEAQETVARELDVKIRAIRSVWEDRYKRGWRPEE